MERFKRENYENIKSLFEQETGVRLPSRRYADRRLRYAAAMAAVLAVAVTGAYMNGFLSPKDMLKSAAPEMAEDIQKIEAEPEAVSQIGEEKVYMKSLDGAVGPDEANSVIQAESEGTGGGNENAGRASEVGADSSDIRYALAGDDDRAEGKADTEEEAYSYDSADGVRASGYDEVREAAAESCRAYLNDRYPDLVPSISNWDDPSVVETEFPEKKEPFPGASQYTAPYYKVSFDLDEEYKGVKQLVFYVDSEAILIGMDEIP